MGLLIKNFGACPDCDTDVGFYPTFELERFLCPDEHLVIATVPIYNCPLCGFQFCDDEAGQVRDVAMKRHWEKFHERKGNRESCKERS